MSWNWRADLSATYGSAYNDLITALGPSGVSQLDAIEAQYYAAANAQPIAASNYLSAFNQYVAAAATNAIASVQINSISTNIPEITQNTPAGTVVGTLTAHNSQGIDNNKVTYSIVGGNSGAFGIQGNNIVVVNPSLLGNGNYNNELQIKATDEFGHYAYQTNIQVIVDQAPTLQAYGIANSLIEGQIGAVAGQIFGQDNSPNDPLTYKIVSVDGKTDAASLAMFTLNGQNVVTAEKLSYNQASSHTIGVEVVDAFGLTATASFTSNVVEVHSAPTAITLSNTSVASNPTPWTVVGHLADIAPNPADMVNSTFQLIGATNNGMNYFWVNGNTNQLMTNQVPPNGTYQLTFVCCDAGGYTLTQTINVTVGAAPQGGVTGVSFSEPNFAIEHVASGQTVGTLSATDNTSSATMTYSIVGGTDAALFKVVGNQLVTASALPDVGNHTFQVQVQATDNFGKSLTQTINITAVEPTTTVSALSLSNATVAGLQAGSVVGTLSATDSLSGVGLTYAITGGADASHFSIVNGQLVDTVAENYVTAASRQVTVTATDAFGAHTSQTFNVGVAPVAPTAVSVSPVATVYEHVAAGQVVGTLSASTTEVGDTFTYSIVGGTDAALFKVVGNQLVTASALPDLGAHGFNVIVQAADPAGLKVQQSVTINAIEPTGVVSGLALSNAAVAGETAGAVVGNLSASDTLTNPGITYAITGGADASHFSIVNGQLVDTVAENYLTAASRQVTVTATDVLGDKASQTFTVGVNDVAPTAVSITPVATVYEHVAAGQVVGTLSGTDLDAGDVLTYSIVGGADAALFKVVGNQLVTASALPDLGAHGFNVIVQATDKGGLSVQRAITINAVEPSSAVSNLTLSNATVAGETAGAVVGTLSATDSVSGLGITYAITGGADASHFSIVNGQLVDTAAENYVTAASRQVTVTATDTFGAKASQTFTVGVNDVAPTAVSVAPVATVYEHIAAGQVVGTLSGTDPDAGDVLTYSIVGGADAALFKVVGNQLVTASPLPDLGAHGFNVVVQATDKGGLSVQQSVTINAVEPVSVVSNLALSNATVAGESAGAVVGTLSATDSVATNAITYTITGGADASHFSIVNNQLVDTVAENYITAASRQVTVTATDSTGSHTSQTFTVGVNDVAPTAVSVTPVATVYEHIAAGQVVGTLSGTDPDAGDVLTYSIVGGTDAALFKVVGNQLVTASALPDVGNHAFNVVLQATDKGGLSVQQAVTINAVEPTGVVSGLALSNSTIVGEQAEQVVGTLSASDTLTNPGITYTITGGADASHFSIVNNQLVDKVAEDYITSATRQVAVTATDAFGGHATQTFTVNVSDVAPTSVGFTQTPVVYEHVPAGQFVGTMAGTDPDSGDTLTYSIVGGADAALFKVVGNVLATVGPLPDVGNHAFNVVLQATDKGGLSVQQAVTINAVEPPTSVTSLTLSNSSVAGETAGAIVGNLSSTDSYTGLGVSYAITGGADASHFSIVNNQLIDNVAEDYITAASRQVTITATDVLGAKLNQTFTIGVNDVAPTSVSLAPVSNVLEHQAAGQVVGTLSGTDPDAGDVLTYSVVGGADASLFKVVGNQLVTTGPLPDLGNHAFNVIVQATDKGGLSVQHAFTVNAIESQVTSLSLSNTSVAGEQSGAVVGTLTSTDLDPTAHVTYTLSGANASEFTVVGNQLETAVPLNYLNGNQTVTVTAQDNWGSSVSNTYSVVVNDAAPTSAGFAQVSTPVFEHIAAGQVVGTFAGTDPDAGDVLTYSIVGGTDAALFKVVGNQLVTTSALPDLGNHAFNVVVQATDKGGLSVQQSVSINAVEPVYSISSVGISNASVGGEAAAGTIVGSLTATDTDPSATYTYAITGGTNASNFAIDSHGNLVTTAPLHFMQGPENVIITATDNHGDTATHSFTINVNDVLAPTSLALNGQTVTATEGAGTVVGSLIVTDPNVGDTFNYSIVGGTDASLFSVDANGHLTLTAQAGYNYGTARDVIVHAVDAGGLSINQEYHIHVNGVAPTGLTLSTTTIADSTPAGTVATYLTPIGLDPTDSVTYSLSGTSANMFTVYNNELLLAHGVTYAGTGGHLDVTVTATEKDGYSYSQAVDFTVPQPVVTTPSSVLSNLALSNLSVNEQMPAGIAVGSLSSVDTAGLPVTYTISGGSNASDFAIQNGQLVTTTSFLGAQTESVNITATDTAGHSITQDFSVKVIAQNIQYGSGPVTEDPSAPNMFESDGGNLDVTGFNENNGDNINMALIFGSDTTYLNSSYIRLVGTDASHIEVQVTDGTVPFFTVVSLENAVSSDGILQGHSGAITQAQLNTLEQDWFNHYTLHL